MTSAAVPIFAVLAAALAPEHVPEGIHSLEKGEIEICGTKAGTVLALFDRMSKLPPLPGNDRYVAFEDSRKRRVWTFTTAAHPAHPAVACRSVVEKDGSVLLGLEISCHSTREKCDALYREFEALNARIGEKAEGAR